VPWQSGALVGGTATILAEWVGGYLLVAGLFSWVVSRLYRVKE